MVQSALVVAPDRKFRLAKHSPAETLGMSKQHAEASREKHVRELAVLHDLLYAEHRRSVLIVLQGMDTAGKDGTIRHVMSGVNPQGCRVTSFKQPTPNELDHDFLWRIHAAVPERGSIGIFNRSHYESVLVERVHKLAPRGVWKKRYQAINDFERILSESGVHLLKFFLHVSKEEQKRRLEERLADPDKNWKASPADFVERKFWDDYQGAYEDAMSECSTKYAPWFVIPSDYKWFRNHAVAEIVVRTMRSFGMRFPSTILPSRLARGARAAVDGKVLGEA